MLSDSLSGLKIQLKPKYPACLVAHRLTKCQHLTSKFKNPKGIKDSWQRLLTNLNLHLKIVSKMAQLFKVDEVAKELQISRATLYRLIARGYIQPIKVGRSVRFTQKSIDLLIKRLETQTRENEVGF